MTNGGHASEGAAPAPAPSPSPAPAPAPSPTAGDEAGGAAHAVTGAVPPAIRVRHLWHRFGGRDVLRDVTFDVGAGEIFGFIGPNGAGKTTTIRVMATLLEPMAGRVEIDGHDVTLAPERVRRAIGYMPDHAGVYERITVREYLEFFAAAFRVEDGAVVDTVLELTELRKLEDRLVATMSKGMKQRLQLARILLHDPRVLLLDEPASDLDPRARIELRDLLLELRNLGKTIFLSSHILTELADVCSSVAILEQGRLVVAGSIDSIAERLRQARADGAPASRGGDEATGPVSARRRAQLAAASPGGDDESVRRVKLRIWGDARLVPQLLQGAPGLRHVEVTGPQQLIVTYSGDERFVALLVRHLVARDVPIIGVEPERNELERIFLEATRGDLQ